MHNIIKNKYYILAFVLLLVSAQFMKRNQAQAPSWTAPYFSGATNLLDSGSWNINNDEIIKFSKLTREQQFTYKFKELSDTKYLYNAPGLLYVIIVAKKIFFKSSDYNSLIYFQQFIHIILTLSILYLIRTKRSKILFFILYGVNPLILYFVNFPFYYFWQAIPSGILLGYFILNRKISYKLLLLAPVLSICFLIRPTSLGVIGLFYFFSFFKKENISLIIFSLLIFIATYLSLQIKTVHSPWHTLYIGKNAYSSTMKLSDGVGFDVFNQTFKTNFNYSQKVLANDTKFLNKYTGLMKKKYIEVALNEPLLLVKNLVLNIISSYGISYKTGNQILIYTNVIIGSLVILSLIYFRQWFLILFIGSINITFTPYYPPIAAYMFGAFIVITYAATVILDKIILKIGSKSIL